MKKDEEYILKAEKLINNGCAIARQDNFPVFIEEAAPDDIVRVKIHKLNKNYALAKIIGIIEKSPKRTTPFCALHNICGSCAWQYINYNEQLKQKELIVKETLEKFADEKIHFESIIPSPLTKEYRCKIQFPASQTKVSKKILTGYYKKNSHDLINIKYCPMQPDIINNINEFLKEKASDLCITGYNEKSHSGLLRHIIYRISSDLKQILIILVINSEIITPCLKELSDILIKKYPLIKGVCANFNTKKTNVIMSPNTKTILGQDYYIETLNNIKYKISSNSFFQVNPLCAVKIFDKVKELISARLKNPTILDSYSGVSSFGIWLSDIASKITCIEEVESASNDAIENIKLNNIKNIEIINGDAAVEFKKLINQKAKFDVTITDPPRKGCSKEAINALINLTSKYLIYVSCNPASLARDIKILKSKGFVTLYVQPADLFPHTYHVETIVLFEKQ